MIKSTENRHSCSSIALYEYVKMQYQKKGEPTVLYLGCQYILLHNLVQFDTIISMSVLQLIRKNKGLLKAFKSYQKRYLSVGKKPDFTKSFPEIVYRTTRLEGEVITRQQAQMLFK